MGSSVLFCECKTQFTYFCRRGRLIQLDVTAFSSTFRNSQKLDLAEFGKKKEKILAAILSKWVEVGYGMRHIYI